MGDERTPEDEDFRGTRETKRRDETVMLGADALSSMVDEAKQAPAAPTAPAAPAADEAGSGSGVNVLVMAAVGIVILLVVIALVVNYLA